MNKLTIMAASLPDTPPLEYVQAAASAGYDGIGLRLYKSPSFPNWKDWLDDEPLKREVKRAVAGEGVDMNEILSYYMTPDVDLNDMAASLEYGAGLGAEYAWVAGRDDDFNRLCDSVGKFSDIAASFDVTAMLGGPIGNFAPLENAFKVIEAVKRPNVVVCVGAGLFLRAGQLSDIEGKDRRLLPFIHLNDGNPFDKISGLLDALPIDVILSVEVPNRTGRPQSALDWCKSTLARTKEFLAEYHGRGA